MVQQWGIHLQELNTLLLNHPLLEPDHVVAHED